MNETAWYAHYAMAVFSFRIAILGSGGAGVMTVGSCLLSLAARFGLFGFFEKLFGPSVRGGEAMALLTLSNSPTYQGADEVDLVLGLDWEHAERFSADLMLSSSSVVLADEGLELPKAFLAASPSVQRLPLAMLAKKASSRANMVALGFLANALGFSIDAAQDSIAAELSALGEEALQSARRGIALGAAHPPPFSPPLPLSPIATPRRLLSGNEAVGLGALRAGVRFVAAYPITPATEIAEFLSPWLSRFGTPLFVAEDELAAVNAAIGASFGGVPSMTMTSGPGLSLMVESIGLAVATETPLLVVDVMRAGPSTGIPTRSEQADLLLACHGAHGDAPRVVLAPTGIADAISTTEWAVEIAETLQTPVLLLSDQFLGQTRAIVEGSASPIALPRRVVALESDEPFLRYRNTESGLSPTSIPGMAGRAWVADGLSHQERGQPSSAARDHAMQIEKRARKLQALEPDARILVEEGEGDLAVLTWGSSSGPAREAIARLRERGVAMRLLVLRLLYPLFANRLLQSLMGVRKAIVVELNDSGQLFGLLRAELSGQVPLRRYSRAGGAPFRAKELFSVLEAWRQEP